MKTENKATLVVIIAAIFVSLMLQSCGNGSTPNKENHDTARISKSMIDVLRYGKYGEVQKFEYEGRIYTLWNARGAGGVVVLHIEEAKSEAQVYLEENIIR